MQQPWTGRDTAGEGGGRNRRGRVGEWAGLQCRDGRVESLDLTGESQIWRLETCLTNTDQRFDFDWLIDPDLRLDVDFRQTTAKNFEFFWSHLLFFRLRWNMSGRLDCAIHKACRPTVVSRLTHEQQSWRLLARPRIQCGLKYYIANDSLKKTTAVYKVCSSKISDSNNIIFNCFCYCKNL